MSGLDALAEPTKDVGTELHSRICCVCASQLGLSRFEARRVPPNCRRTPNQCHVREGVLALTRFKPTLGLVDNVDPTPAAHHSIVTVSLHQRFQRVLDLHRYRLSKRAPMAALGNKKRAEARGGLQLTSNRGKVNHPARPSCS